MVVISQLAIYKHQSTLTSLFLVFMILITKNLYGECKNEDIKAIYLNVKCDFERIPGGGCHLRESYCSLHTCICKPDFPINIADRLCITKHKSVFEQCTFSQECQAGSYCAEMNNSRVCLCKTGHAYSSKTKQCVKGLKGSICRNDADCLSENQFCSLSVCDCMYGFEWFNTDEVCHKKSRYGQACENPINCKIHDEFSECDPISKKCTCGQFLSRKYALDEVTDKCVSCPSERYHNATNTCLPEKMTVEYSLLDRSTYERNSHQYVYIALSMTPFIVFALIGFIYRYVNPSANLPDQLSEQVMHHSQVLTLSRSHNIDYSVCLQIDFNGNPVAHRTSDSHTNLALLGTPIIPIPPPTYDIASQDLPPPYDEVVGQRVLQ